MKSFQPLTSFRRPYQVQTSSSTRFSSLGTGASIKNSSNGFALHNMQTINSKTNHTLLGQKAAAGNHFTSGGSFAPPPKAPHTPHLVSLEQQRKTPSSMPRGELAFTVANSIAQSSKILSQKNDYLNVNGFGSAHYLNSSSSQQFKKSPETTKSDLQIHRSIHHPSSRAEVSTHNGKQADSRPISKSLLPSQVAQGGLTPAPHNRSITKPSDRSKKQEVIVIHVCDQTHKVNKDFKCEKNLLLSHMKYFEKYINNQSVLEDIDISVHCDINIFEWLMKYLHHNQNQDHRPQESTPKLEVSNVVSILISSDFLQMKELVEQCITFIRTHINQVVRLPIDLNCLNPSLIRKLSNKFKAEDIDSMRDRKDKLMSKIYERKLEELLKDQTNQFYLCVYCDQLYTNEQRDWMVCDKAKIFIDFHGCVIAQHVADRSFDMQKFLMSLKNSGMTWRQIYWKIWGKLVSFYCVSCQNRFLGAQFAHCSYHPNKPKFTFGSNNGYYPCCNSEALRFHTSIQKLGCMAKLHKVNYQDQNCPEAKNFQILEKKFALVHQPFINSKGELVSNQLVKSLLQESQRSEKAPLKQPISFNGKLRDFLRSWTGARRMDMGQEDEQEEDAQEEDPNGTGETDDSEESSSSQQDLPIYTSTAASTFMKAKPKRPSVVKRGKHHKKAGVAKKIGYSLKVQRQWRMDGLREFDFNQMDELTKNLMKVRKSEKVLFKKKGTINNKGAVSAFQKQKVQERKPSACPKKPRRK